MQLLEVLRIKKIQIPDEISIVGYDDSFLAEISEVKLTTIIHPKIEMGKEAANLIIDLIENKNKKGNGLEHQRSEERRVGKEGRSRWNGKAWHTKETNTESNQVRSMM